VSGQALVPSGIRLDVTIMIRDPLPNGYFIGPTVRGLLGYAVKRASCVTDHGECARCLLRNACAYPLIFAHEAGEGPKGAGRLTAPEYSVMVDPPGAFDGLRHIRFTIWLFGNAARWMPQVIDGILRSESSGFGSSGASFTLLEVRSGSTVVWSRSAPAALLNPIPIPLVTRTGPVGQTLRLRMITPLELQPSAKTPGMSLVFALILSARRRWRVMCEVSGSAPPQEDRIEDAQFQVLDHRTVLWTGHRRSVSEGTAMPLQGVLGEMIIAGPWERAGDWLRALDAIAVGRHTSFGMGRLQWDVPG
jgi:hypothetical protein